MADFRFEVLSTYATQGDLKVSSISFNDRDPKFDIRHWKKDKDGKEIMGKGVTLTVEELQFLAEELPNVIKSLTGGKGISKSKKANKSDMPFDADDDDTSDDEADVSELPERSQKLIALMQETAKNKGVNVVDGVTYANNGTMMCALKGTGDFAISKVDFKSKFDSVLSNLKPVTVDIKALRNATKTRLAKDTMYSISKNLNLVNADLFGKAVRAVGDDAKVYTDKANNFYVAKGSNGEVVLCVVKQKAKKVGLIKTVA